MSKVLSLMQRANNFPCDWVIAGIHKNNDKEVKSRMFYMPEEWSTWFSWVKSQLWCATQSIVFPTELNCFFFSCMVEIVLYACSVLLVAVWTKYGNFYYCFLRFQGTLFVDPWRWWMIWVGIGSRQCCLDRVVPLVRKYVQHNGSCKQLWAAPDFSYMMGELIFVNGTLTQ